MDNQVSCCASSEHLPNDNRRTWLKTTLGAAATLGLAGSVNLLVPNASEAASLTQAERDKMTPDQVIESLKQGNARFRAGKPTKHDYLAQKQTSASGQFPAAAILSCIDSRAPAEIVFDAGIGDSFNARVAGNIANDDLIGSLEFACAAAGAKLVLVMGHTSCGAVAGAIDGVQLGLLTGLLEKIKPAAAATQFTGTGERNGKNYAYVDAVAKTNVQHTIQEIRQRSPILAGLEKEGKIKIVGAMYHLNGGMVEFLA